jgi:hypothetical protein
LLTLLLETSSAMVTVLLVFTVVAFIFLLVFLVLVVISFFIFLLYGKPSGASTNALLRLLGSRNKAKIFRTQRSNNSEKNKVIDHVTF